ncbi:hypothetical protein AVEN_13256-1 [Araneus ventricosus]|uniref:LEM domain-containing protein n=1 Tax=Araneus ventricosus TaxID=182803 RepID=A0A4Y2DKV4_ARAVE|nr:hypothetical protein AVEN_13256-1 [Araneus ventricosus]
MADLTDSELRKQLEAYGEDVGPINASTRSQWEKRLLKLKSSRIPRKVEKPLYPKTSTSDIDIATVYGSHRIDNGAFNRNDAVNRIKMSSPNSSEERSFEFDYSPVTGEPGNSPYPFRAKPKATSLEERTDRRMFDIESPNFEMHRNFEDYRNVEEYCELKDKRKIIYRFPTVDGKKEACEKETARQEPAADSGEEWSDCDEEYFLAENLVKTKRGTLETIGNVFCYLLKGVLLIIIVSLCLDTGFFKSVSRGRF